MSDKRILLYMINTFVWFCLIKIFVYMSGYVRSYSWQD